MENWYECGAYECNDYTASARGAHSAFVVPAEAVVAAIICRMHAQAGTAQANHQELC